MLTDSNVKVFKEITDGLFRKILALVIIIGGGWYLWVKAPHGEVKAYVFGVISVAVGFYFNTSQGSSEKAKLIKKAIENGAD